MGVDVIVIVHVSLALFAGRIGRVSTNGVLKEGLWKGSGRIGMLGYVRVRAVTLGKSWGRMRIFWDGNGGCSAWVRLGWMNGWVRGVGMGISISMCARLLSGIAHGALLRFLFLFLLFLRFKRRNCKSIAFKSH